MSKTATGPFEVKVAPLPSDFSPPDADLGRMSIEKQIHGDLEGTSNGQMLIGGNIAKGSAGYVAIEKVTGTLQGRKGSFILQHSATMDHNVPHLIVTVVPESGTGELAGITGTMTIQITGGKHFYTLEYSLPEAQ